MPSEKDDWAERMLAMANSMRSKPLDIPLGSPPGPYQLPRCVRAALNIPEREKPQLLLDTEAGHRVLIPISTEALQTLGNLISDAIKS